MMPNRLSVPFLTAFCLLLVGQMAMPCRAAGKLNLLYITADDMNADSSGWMGNKMGATPTLDALAASSHRFINHHVTAPICQPSREAMMTGLVPHRSGALGFHPIKPGTPTLVTLLAANGYYTAAINKTAHMKPAAEFPWDEKFEGSGKNPPLLREQFETTLKQATAAGKPFFINVNITDPHRPFPGSGATDEGESDEQPNAKKAKGNAKKAAKQKQANAKATTRVYNADEIKVPDFLENIPPVRTEVAQYFTAIARFDESLKGVLQALSASGHDNDTIVLFVSDHGMSFPFSKATVYRNGTWSPVIMKWPTMPAAAAHEEWVGSVDILPTLLDILGIAKPDGIDGRSWMPLLKGESQSGRDFVITHVNTVSSGMSLPQRCLRTEDAALMFHAWPDGKLKFKVEAMSGITYKALEAAGEKDEKIAGRVKQLRVGDPLMFFDERTDPSERSNLIHDSQHKAEIERLAALLLAHMQSTGDPQTENFQQALDNWRKPRGPVAPRLE